MIQKIHTMSGCAVLRRLSMMLVLLCACVFSMQAQTTLLPNSDREYANNRFGKNMQVVHEDWHVIYATPNSTVTLHRRTAAFYQYALWYDYQTNGTNSQLTVTNGTNYVNKSVNTTRGRAYYDMGQPANAWRGDDDHRVCATYTVPNTANFEPVYIACDQSNYEWTQAQRNGSIEPTLSQRIVYEIRPASEMATKMNAATGGNWLEIHTMIAPTNRTLHIGPDYEFNGDNSNYFYGSGNGTRAGISGLKNSGSSNANTNGWHWRKSGGNYSAPTISSNQFMEVTETSEGTVTYELTYKTSNATYNVAKFVVTYIADTKVGPRTSVSYESKYTNLEPIAEEKFNFVGNPTYTTSAGTKYYTKPFPQDQSSFGFFYGKDKDGECPVYNKYAITTTTKEVYGCKSQSVKSLTSHGGGNGYLVYVDGSDIVGQVFSLDIKDLTLCPNAVMYFSAYVGDVSTPGQGVPDLDFIVTGIKSDNSEEIITTFTTGEFSYANTRTGINGKGSNDWMHIVFPIEFRSGSMFKNFRLKITNKCANNNGNDFAIDDITVYLQPAPLTPIEATSPATCLDDNTPLVLYTKIDYGRVENFAGKDYYYRWLDENGNPIDAPYLNKVTDSKGKSAGKITFPSTYLGTAGVGSEPTKVSFQVFNAAYYNLNVANGATAQYAYIRDQSAAHFDGISDDRYSAFIATPIPLGTSGRGSEYTCVVGFDIEQLGTSTDCSNSQTIPLTSGMGVHSEAAGATVKGLEQKACANFSYDLTFLVKYVVLEGKDGTTTKDSRYKAHWLFGVKPDPTDENEVAEFMALYGASFDAIKAALEHLNVDAKKDAVSTMTPLESDVYEALKTANGGTYPVYAGSADEKLVNRLVQKGLLVLASSLEDPFKYVVMPLSEQTRLSVTAFPVEKEKSDAPDCLTPQSITLTFKNLGPDDEPAGDQDVMTFVKSYTEVVPAFVASRPRRVRVPMYNSARERVSTKDVLVKLTNPTKEYVLGKTYLYSTDDAGATVSSATPTTLVSATHEGSITGETAVTFNGLNNLKEGHTYTFKVLYTPKTAGATPSDKEVDDYCGGVDPDDPTKLRSGEAYITFVIVPDKLTFAPSELEGSWDDDYSFRFTDSEEKEYNVAPSQYTSVLFAAGNHILLNRTTNKFQEPGDDRKVDLNALPYITWDIDYEPNVAKNVYVPAGTAIVGQTNIDVKGGYTFDMPLNANTWTMSSMPIQGVVSGDMYITKDGDNDKVEYANGNFVVKPMDQTSGTWAADREVYSFYNSMYNSEVYHYEPDYRTNITSSTWSFATNSLNTPFTAGMGWAVGLAPADGATQTYVRLPKQETVYNYFRNDTWTGYTETVDRTNVGKPMLTFADGKMTITLSNNEDSNIFLFGNPSFANIDLKTLFEKNTNLDGTFYLSSINASNRYDHVTGRFAAEGWVATTLEAMPLLAPYQAVLVKANTSAKSLSLDLTPDMFVTTPATDAPATTSAPRRVAAAEALRKAIYIAAETEAFHSTALLMEREDASNEALETEDADVFLLDKAKTPFAIYTVADEKALAINQIADQTIVPLGFYAQKQVLSEQVTFSGDDRYLAEWDLIDNQTGSRETLYSGFATTLSMNNQGVIRYYLEHARKGIADATTGFDDLASTGINAYAHDGQLTAYSADDMTDFCLYDAAGRTIATSKNAGRMAQFNLANGVYVVRASGDVIKVIVK